MCSTDGPTGLRMRRGDRNNIIETKILTNSFAEVCVCWPGVVNISSDINYRYKDSLDNQIARVKAHSLIQVYILYIVQ